MGITQSTSNNKTKEIIKQIEELTERRINNILFDSYKDNWNKNTSVFGERIMNKEYIIIIIEDSDGNKFGGYVNSKIDKNQMEEMKKFDIKEPEKAFYLYHRADNYLFAFGSGADIIVYKENIKTKSFCKQSSFSYKGISNALCGKYYFKPKHFIVIEMK
ncbi:trichohyalin, putative [Entamoeba histolytica]